MSNPVKREITRQKLERRGGVFGLLYVKGETEPFTGTAFLSYANGSKYGVTPFVNGQKDGKQIWYNENGSKRREILYENGNEISRKEF
jgi:antitoxin component YwqK of YwqJK toxin-antitoxin module